MSTRDPGAQPVRPRARAILAVIAAMALALPIIGNAQVAGAGPVSSHFELDGNVQREPDLPQDWADLYAPTPVKDTDPAFLASTAIPVFDGADAPTDTTYWKGGGSKDVNDIHRWAYSGTDVAPDKNEIVNAAAAAYAVPSGPGEDDPDDLVITFTSDRYSNDGDAAIGFWFFKKQVGTDGNGKFTGEHEDGDVLVVSDFNEGENVNTIRVFEWKKGVGLVEPTIPGGTVFDCRAFGANPNVCATQNATEQNAIWPYTPKANVGTSGKYPAYTFLEGAVNISKIFPDSEDQCFASFLAETRSSTSPTAQLKDFVGGRFPICEPATTLTASTPDGGETGPEIVVAGDSVDVTFNEENTGNITLTDVYVESDDCDIEEGPTTLEPGEDADFTCTVETTEGTAEVIEVTATGHGTDPIGRDVTACEDPEDPPADTVCDANEQDTAEIVAIVPSTNVTVSVDPDVAKAGDLVTYTIVEENDGEAPDGYDSALDITSPTLVASSTTAPLLAEECNVELDAPISGDDGDGVLEKGEEWTYECTVTAGSEDFSITFDASGIVLEGTSYEKTHGPKDTNDIIDTDETGSAGVTVISPSTDLTITASALITYTFAETNDGSEGEDLIPPNQNRESVLTADTDMCDTAIVYTGGDTGDLMVLEAGETWTFTCTATLDGPATDGDSSTTGQKGANGHGVDATGDDVTHCEVDENGTPIEPEGTHCDQDERDSVTVSITHHQG